MFALAAELTVNVKTSIGSPHKFFLLNPKILFPKLSVIQISRSFLAPGNCPRE